MRSRYDLWARHGAIKHAATRGSHELRAPAKPEPVAVVKAKPPPKSPASAAVKHVSTPPKTVQAPKAENSVAVTAKPAPLAPVKLEARAPAAAPVPAVPAPSQSSTATQPQPRPGYRVALVSFAIKSSSLSAEDQIREVWRAVSEHPDIEPFLELPPRSEFADYYLYIKAPICLSDIAARIAAKRYASVQALSADLELMFANARLFNETGSPLFNLATTLRQFLRNKVSAVARGLVPSHKPGRGRPPGSKNKPAIDAATLVPRPAFTDASIAAEREQLELTLRELYRADAIREGSVLSFNRRRYSLNANGVFEDSVHGLGRFPTVANMREVMQHGGFGTNGWKPIRIGEFSISELRENMHMLDELGPELTVALWGDDSNYQRWLEACKDKWKVLRTKRFARNADSNHGTGAARLTTEAKPRAKLSASLSKRRGAAVVMSDAFAIQQEV